MAEAPAAIPEGASLRLDKWLFHARFLKSRTQAAALCAGGNVRVNRQPIHKPHQPVRVGDVLTFALGAHIRVIRVVALGVRRGPAPEARTLYEDLAPKPAAPPPRVRAAERAQGAGRPTKADRRAIDRLRGG